MTSSSVSASSLSQLSHWQALKGPFIIDSLYYSCSGSHTEGCEPRVRGVCASFPHINTLGHLPGVDGNLIMNDIHVPSYYQAKMQARIPIES